MKIEKTPIKLLKYKTKFMGIMNLRKQIRLSRLHVSTRAKKVAKSM